MSLYGGKLVHVGTYKGKGVYVCSGEIRSVTCRTDRKDRVLPGSKIYQSISGYVEVEDKEPWQVAIILQEAT